MAVRITTLIARLERFSQQVAKTVPCGLPQGLLEALTLVGQLLRPQVLEETEHFRRLRQQKVVKIVQCGEHYSITNQRRGHLSVALKIFIDREPHELVCVPPPNAPKCK